MRTAFIKKLTQLANADKRVYLITADTGFKVFDEFQVVFPERYLNIGISEANMIGAASGLALDGKIVFVYAIVPFVTMRCFEQIRIDLSYQDLPVKLVGVGGGLTYGSEGATHHAIEDIAIMNSLPNMTVICPGDPVEAANMIEASLSLKGPCYFRLGKSGERVLHKKGLPSFSIGKGILIHKGEDIAIIATGSMLETAFTIHEILKGKGLNPELISMHTIKPLDREIITKAARRCKIVVTVEEHSVIGGLGSCVANVIAEENLNVVLKKFAIPDRYAETAGDNIYLRRQYGLTAEQISEDILNG